MKHLILVILLFTFGCNNQKKILSTGPGKLKLIEQTADYYLLSFKNYSDKPMVVMGTVTDKPNVLIQYLQSENWVLDSRSNMNKVQIIVNSDQEVKIKQKALEWSRGIEYRFVINYHPLNNDQENYMTSVPINP